MALMAAATSSEATGPEVIFLGVPATKLSASGHGSRVLASSRPSAEEANRPTVAGLVYNYAHIPAEKMADSSERVARIFRDAGIDIEWMNPLADHTLIVSPTSNSLMRFTVQMLIRPRRWPPQIGPSTDSVMGIAFPAAANGGTLWLFDETDSACRAWIPPATRRYSRARDGPRDRASSAAVSVSFGNRRDGR